MEVYENIVWLLDGIAQSWDWVKSFAGSVWDWAVTLFWWALGLLVLIAVGYANNSGDTNANQSRFDEDSTDDVESDYWNYFHDSNHSSHSSLFDDEVFSSSSFDDDPFPSSSFDDDYR